MKESSAEHQDVLELARSSTQLDCEVKRLASFKLTASEPDVQAFVTSEYARLLAEKTCVQARLTMLEEGLLSTGPGTPALSADRQPGQPGQLAPVMSELGRTIAALESLRAELGSVSLGPLSEAAQQLRAGSQEDKKAEPRGVWPPWVSVQLPGGEVIDVQVAPNSSIARIKDQAQQQANVVGEDLRLHIGDQTLEDMYTLGWYRYRGHETLQLALELRSAKLGGFPLIVSSSAGKTVVLEVQPFSTVQNVMDGTLRQLRFHTGQDIALSHLSFGSKVLEGSCTLAYYNIKPGVQLHASVKPRGMMVAIKTLYRYTLELEVSRSDTVRELKSKMLYHDGPAVQGIPNCWAAHDLSHNGRVLEDDLTLADYGIQEDAELQLVARIGGR